MLIRWLIRVHRHPRMTVDPRFPVQPIPSSYLEGIGTALIKRTRGLRMQWT